MCSLDDKNINQKLDVLLDDVRRGDDDACAELLRLYAPLLNGLVHATMTKLPSPTIIDEDELRQEAAIILYRAALSYEKSDSVSFGLYAKICMQRRMTSLLRRHECSAELELPLGDFPEDMQETNDGDPSKAVLEREREHELNDLIQNVLSPLEYDVFNLYIDGMRPTEIAGILSISVKTAENAIYRMRLKIKRLID